MAASPIATHLLRRCWFQAATSVKSQNLLTLTKWNSEWVTMATQSVDSGAGFPEKKTLCISVSAEAETVCFQHPLIKKNKHIYIHIFVFLIFYK